MLLDHGKPGHVLQIHVTRDACALEETMSATHTQHSQKHRQISHHALAHFAFVNLKHAHDKMEKGRGHLKLNAHTHVPGTEHPAHGLTLHSKPVKRFWNGCSAFTF